MACVISLPFLSLRVRFEGVQGLGPTAIQPCAHLAEAGRIDPVDVACATGLGMTSFAAFSTLRCCETRRLTDRQRSCQIGDGLRPFATSSKIWRLVGSANAVIAR